MSEQHSITKFFAQLLAKDPENPPIFEIKAPVTMSALQPDGRYRTITLKDEEFMLKGLRPGKRSEWIIELTPVGSATYTQAELLDKDMDAAMPQLEPYLVKALGFEGSKFRTAVKKFLKKEAEEKAAEQGKTESLKYDGNPHWGSF